MEQPSDIAVILSKLDHLCRASAEQSAAIRALSARLDDTNTRLDVSNSQLDKTSRELGAAVVQWKRLGTRVTEVVNDVSDLRDAVNGTPVPVRAAR